MAIKMRATGHRIQLFVPLPELPELLIKLIEEKYKFIGDNWYELKYPDCVHRDTLCRKAPCGRETFNPFCSKFDKNVSHNDCYRCQEKGEHLDKPNTEGL